MGKANLLTLIQDAIYYTIICSMISVLVIKKQLINNIEHSGSCMI